MEPIDEFKGIGKKMPYKVPDDFFEHAALKTLQEAKRREHESRKAIYSWRSVAVAASLAVIGFVGYFMLNKDAKPETQIVVQDSKPVVQPIVGIKVVQPSVDTLPAKKVISQEKVQPAVVKEVPSENMDEILADLTEEELLQMAAMIKTDPFSGEFEQ
jgi:hypothetical protein